MESISPVFSNEEIGGGHHKNGDKVHLARRWGGKRSSSRGSKDVGSVATFSNVESGERAWWTGWCGRGHRANCGARCLVSSYATWAKREKLEAVLLNVKGAGTWWLWKFSASPDSQSVSSVAQSCLTLCDPMDCSTPGLPVHHQLPELAQTHVHRAGELVHPTISSSVVPFFSCLQSFPVSGSFPMSQLFAIRWPKHWSFNFNISPSNEYSGLISFRMDWLDLLAVQGTLKSLLQHHSSKASILRRSAFFIVQLSHPHDYWKNHSFDMDLCWQWCLCFLICCLKFVIAFLPRSKHLLISWLHLPSTVILEPKKIKSVTVSNVSPSICLEVMGPDAMILVFWMLSFKPAFSLFHFYQVTL